MDSLHLRTSSVSPSCKIHPIVIFNILDHFVRRNEGQPRVIGTLTGINIDGYIEIRNCFPVPHTEGEQVGVDMEFHHNMLELHHRVSPKETIIGCGNEITEASVMLHDFYGREISHPPIHLTVDTNLTNYSLGIKAFTSSNITFTDKVLGSQFFPVPIQIQTFDDAEKIGGFRENECPKFLVDLLVKGETNVNIANTLLSDLDYLEFSIKNLQSMLETAQKYVDDVLSDKVTPNSNIGRFLAETVSGLPRLEPSMLEKMFNNSLQDLLLVVYLANLTRTQLTLAEKLQKV